MHTLIFIDLKCHSVHWGIKPPKKHEPPPLKSAICKLSKPVLSGNSPYILVFREPPSLEIGFFCETS